MLPSVNAQKPDVTDPSWASVDVTPKAIVRENAQPIDLIRAGYRRFRAACQPINPGRAGAVGCAGNAASCDIGNMVTRRNYGLRSGGIGGSSRISVIVTRRFDDSEGSSGNSGWVSALPVTAKMWADGRPSRSRIWRTALARSADRSNAP